MGTAAAPLPGYPRVQKTIASSRCSTMSPAVNPAVCVSQDGELSIHGDLSMPVQAPDEVLVEVLYSGINPADVKHAEYCGARPGRPGYDFCGRVLSLPVSSVSGSALSSADLHVGDLVAGYTPPGSARPDRYGAHQAILACPASCVWPVPQAIPPAVAATLTTTLQTVSDALFNRFGFPLPEELNSMQPSALVTGRSRAKNAVLLIWGGSTSLGMATIQASRQLRHTRRASRRPR